MTLLREIMLTQPFFVACVLVVGTAACTPDPPLLRNPHTGKTVRCGPYPFHGPPGSDYSAPRYERECIEDYERQGYERVDQGGQQSK
jgi:hypothetical protein